MKIKPYKIQKRNFGINPFVLVFLPLPKPKIPFYLFTDIHKPNLYQVPKITVEVVGPAVVDQLVEPLV